MAHTTPLTAPSSRASTVFQDTVRTVHNTHSRPVHLELAKGQALTLRPAAPGVLRTTQGRVWATLGNSTLGDPRCHGAGAVSVDYFVTPCDALPVAAGQSVVIEAWPAAGTASVGVSWEPL